MLLLGGFCWMVKKYVSKKRPKKRVYFNLEAPGAKEVILAGTFNNWAVDSRRLRQNKKGVWSTFLSLEPGTYEYRYLVDGTWQNDPDADKTPNEYGTLNCIVTVGVPKKTSVC